VDRLLRYLLDGGDHQFAEELSSWLSQAARFRSFADAHRDKIRKKLRGAADADARKDVRTELNVGRLLLADRRVALEFEAYGSGRPGPDFTVTLGGERFNLEVTRLRGDPASAGFGGLLAKVRQLPPSVANGVILAIDGTDARAYDAAAAVTSLRGRAEAADDALFIARGFRGSRDFRDRLARLGTTFVFAESATGDARAVAWVNPTARIPFSGRAGRACLACLRSGD
jgi:hypothetical protein